MVLSPAITEILTKEQISIEKDPLWFKDAIIYELHVRAFFDSNNDGFGDFQGLIQKLDYLEGLGITCIWLLPFYPSPLKDDGYDIADYQGIHPQYGNLKDFKQFVKEAHRRGMRVVTELVINHTSDQHPWFQAARRAKPGSARRDFYVWSNNPDKFPETRIIFTDTEKSNWTWDDVAGSYYWHRFFSHQPDLNHNNPRVVKEVIRLLRFWLDIGVDGLRLDAIPYLCVREGTNNENLPETHDVIKTIRHAVDEHYEDRMLLAEANQWPEDVRAYFGNGDECHMAFHFPLMPRIFMAIRKEDRHPIVEIIARTPEIPYNCQWGLFLRNHDELTLEMVTDEERDYMYKEYVTDPRMRCNVGIRRRLAPLVDNDIFTIQMLNSILFSFPGTPILYYGDEIGMGDNIFLGDRDGVRTPMQWSIDRNAGFSKADPARLYNPVIMDPVFGYQAVNVEAQERDASSFLNFMKRILALRRQYKAFGRGTFEFLHPKNRKILAYLRRYKKEVLLCVVNLSKNIQPVELDLSEFHNMTPMELFGQTEFPTISDSPYFLSLNGNAFYWFRLEPPAEPVFRYVDISDDSQTEPITEWKTLNLDNGWESLREPANTLLLENDILPEHLLKQPWLSSEAEAASKNPKPIESIKFLDWCRLGADFYFLFLNVRWSHQEKANTYLLPLRICTGVSAQTVIQEMPECILSKVMISLGQGRSQTPLQGILMDALYDESACAILLATVVENRRIPTFGKGHVQAAVSLTPRELKEYETKNLNVRQITPVGKSRSIHYDEWMIFKIQRRVEAGVNPDIEIREYLLKHAGFKDVPPIRGTLSYFPGSGPILKSSGIGPKTSALAPMNLGLFQQFIENQGNMLTFTNVLLKMYQGHWIESRMLKQEQIPLHPPLPCSKEMLPESGDLSEPLVLPEIMRDSLLGYENFYPHLGLKVAELHLALGRSTRQMAFSPERVKVAYLEAIGEEGSRKALRVSEKLEQRLKELPTAAQELGVRVLQALPVLRERLGMVAKIAPQFNLIRCHGFLKLHNLLQTDHDSQNIIFVDFEGDDSLSIEARRQKQCALQDVACLLDSVQSACQMTLEKSLKQVRGGAQQSEHPIEDVMGHEPWFFAWEAWVQVLIMKSYFSRVGQASFLPQEREQAQRLLSALVLDKALDRLERGLDQRSALIQLPLSSILWQLGLL